MLYLDFFNFRERARLYRTYSLARFSRVEEQTQSLNNLQITLFHGKYECVSGDENEGKCLVKKIMNGDKSIFSDDFLKTEIYQFKKPQNT